VLHACTVEDEAFVGMGATLLNGVVIEKGAFVAAGAVVSENTRIPAGQVLNLLLSLVLESAPGFFVPCLPGVDC
jgi:carbonic anhydrase/acetyltransferase-like protein (isoleucine patch superfamily)